jgi:hypothetical protein
MAMVYIKDPAYRSHFKVNLDDVPRGNGSLFSSWLTVGRDGFTRGMMDSLLRLGKAIPVSEAEWQHSGCQSACIRRGDPICRLL